jgi:hypothetical protein
VAYFEVPIPGRFSLPADTIQYILHRLKAKSLAKRKRKQDPARYGVETNYAIFCGWLLKQKQRDDRRAWLVRTWLEFRHEAPEKLNSLVKAVGPVLESLDAHTEVGGNQITDSIRKFEPILYPLPALNFTEPRPRVLAL